MTESMDVVFRVDATPEIGAGHLMRCAALGESWIAAQAGTAVFWGEVSVPFARRRVESLGARIVDRHPSGERDAVLVCDHYDAAVRAATGSTDGFVLRVIVDDLGEPIGRGYDVAWNPNAYGSPRLYPGFAGTVLSGPDMIPLRGGLPIWHGQGGGRTAVMLGGGRPHPAIVEGLERMAQRSGTEGLTGSGDWVPRGWGKIATENPWDDVVHAGRLITSSGTTVWEAACVGIPVVLVQMARNQDLVFQWARDRGVPGVDALALIDDPERLARALEDSLARARSLPRIENGAPTVCKVLRELSLVRRP